jgi:hypothetical protein
MKAPSVRLTLSFGDRHWMHCLPPSIVVGGGQHRAMILGVCSSLTRIRLHISIGEMEICSRIRVRLHAESCETVCHWGGEELQCFTLSANVVTRHLGREELQCFTLSANVVTRHLGREELQCFTLSANVVTRHLGGKNCTQFSQISLTPFHIIHLPHHSPSTSFFQYDGGFSL